jgi:hypothetical protein
MSTPNVSLTGAVMTQRRTYIPGSAYQHIMNEDAEAQGHVRDSGVVHAPVVEHSRAEMRVLVDLYA